jgi:serine/threonine protein kinase
LNHPNILKFIGVDGQTFKETTSLGMVSPWMELGTMMEFIKSSRYSVPEDRQRLVSRGHTVLCSSHPFLSQIIEVAEGLDYLHQQKMAHGDLHGVRRPNTHNARY